MSVTFYPTLSCGEVGKWTNTPRALLPASSWAGYELREHGVGSDGFIRRIPVPDIPTCIQETTADCGGFVATKTWKRYIYTPEQYVEWLYGVKPSWAAMMDFCCEDEITAGKPGIVKARQDATTDMACHFWETYHDVPWVWVPTIQGWQVEDYKRHARVMHPLIQEMQAHYGTNSAFRVGIGTLCHRASIRMIQAVVHAVSMALPSVKLHLWGVKLNVLQSEIALSSQVASVDSAAWNGLFMTGRQKWKASGKSQRQYCFEDALPAYERKIAKALSLPKMDNLFNSLEENIS